MTNREFRVGDWVSIDSGPKQSSVIIGGVKFARRRVIRAKVIQVTDTENGTEYTMQQFPDSTVGYGVAWGTDYE